MNETPQSPFETQWNINPASTTLQNQILENSALKKVSLQEKLSSIFLKLLTQLKKLGIQPPSSGIQSNMKFWHYWLISKKDTVEFIEQLSTLLSSGIRLVDSLVIIKQQGESRVMKKLVEQLVNSVRSGLLLSQAMGQHPQLFPAKWISLVKAGEKSGQLERILLDLSADELEQQQLLSSLKGAMAYPVFVIILTCVLVGYMLIVVVPEISDIYAKMHQKLPAPTLFIIALSAFLQQAYIILLGGIIGCIIAIKTSSHFFEIIRDIFDFIKLHIPIFGNLRKKQNIALFAGNLSLLLQSGVLIVDALGIVREVLTSPLYKKELERITQGVTQGKKMSQEMGLINLQKEEFEKNFYFPLNVSQMVHIGEETGALVPILAKMKTNYTNQINLTVKTFSSLLEPFMIIIVGALVGGILLAVILPFFSMKV